MHILELPSKDSDDVVPFQQIETVDSLDNIFADIANEANMTISEAKRRIAIHGSSPILVVKNVLLGEFLINNLLFLIKNYFKELYTAIMRIKRVTGHI